MMDEPKTENLVYAPFLNALTLAHKKRHIHKIARVTTSSRDPEFGYFLEVGIKPHRSRDFQLEMSFGSSNRSKPNLIRVSISTHTKENSAQGALGDAMMLLGEIVTAWTAIVESA